jgi:hypothetical protein
MFVGVLQVIMSVIFDGSVATPEPEMIWPRYSTESVAKLHLDSLTRTDWLAVVQNSDLMLFMFLDTLTVNKDIVEEDEYKLPQSWSKDAVHEFLEGGWCVG